MLSYLGECMLSPYKIGSFAQWHEIIAKGNTIANFWALQISTFNLNEMFLKLVFGF